MSAVLVVAAATLLFGASAVAQTSVALSVDVLGTTAPVTTVARGNGVTLRAEVTNSSSGAVEPGTVSFIDLSLPSTVQTVGSAQLLLNGTAVLSIVPAAGSHTYRAVFTATKTNVAGISPTETLNVTGLLGSATTLAAVGTPADYTLTATISGYGFAAAPTGTVNFIDTSASNAVVGTANLSSATFVSTEVAQAALTTGSQPSAMAVGDLNGDGIPDVVIANSGSGSVTVMLGNGDGTFSASATISGLGKPTAVIAADLNNDGILDLAIIDNQNGNVLIYLGNGDGTFHAGASIPVGTNPYAVAAGDLNLDGNLDLAVTVDGTNSVAVLLGAGDGTFTVGTPVTVGTTPYGVVIADFNNDGNPDIAVANFGSGNVSVALGTGNGTFTVAAGSPVSVGNGPVALAAADLNADGSIDLAVANQTDGTVDALLGNGAGGFAIVGSPLPVDAQPSAIVAADFNGDGTLDLLTANAQGATVSVLHNNGNATFAAAVPVTAGTGADALAAIDLNGDGRADLIVANSSPGNANVYLAAQVSSVSVSNITFAATGSHLAVATYSGDSNFATSTSSPVSLQSDTTATTTTLTASPVSPSAYGQTIVLTATIVPATNFGNSAGGTVTFYDFGTPISAAIAIVNGVASATLTLQALGAHTYTAIYSGSTGFLTSTSSALPYTVAQGPVTLTLAAYSGAYGVAGTTMATVAAQYIIAGEAVPTGTISYQFPGFGVQTATLSGGQATINVPAALAIGTATISVTYSGDANYATTVGSLTYTITGQPLTVTVNNATSVYGAAFPTFTGTITGAVNGDTFTATYSTVATPASAVGTYAITATVQGANIANYSVTVVPGTLTITPAPITISANNATSIFGQAFPTFTGNIAGALNGDVLTLTFTTSATTTSNVGTYPIVPALNGAAAGNYTVTVVDGTLTITPLTITVTANNATRLYGAANPAFTGTITGAPANSGLTVTGTTTATQFSPVGSYPITPVLSGTVAANYIASYVQGTLTITQTPTTTLLVSSAASIAYGSSVTFTATVTPGTAGVPTGPVSFFDGTTLLGTVSLVSGSVNLPTIGLAVGVHTITAVYSGDTNFGGSSSNSIAQLVVQATLNVTVNNATRVYGAADPVFTSTITGAVPGDTFTVTYTTNETATSGIGSYLITPTAHGTALANYNVVYTPGTLTITPATLTITANSVTRQYDVANPVFTGSASGAVNGDLFTLSFSTTATTLSDVGTYPIVPAVTGTNLVNYTVNVVNGTLTITPATGIVVTAGNASRAYGTANPVFTGTVSGSFANLGFTVTGTTTATITSDAGQYPIVPTLSGVNPADYTATVVDGILTVTPAGSSIVLVSGSLLANAGTNVTLTATVTSATTGTPTGQVFFYSGTTFLGASPLVNGVATLTTNAIPQGIDALTAHYNGNIDFTSSVSNTVIETIQSGVLLVTVTNASRAYGAANPAFTSTITGALPGDVFTVSYSTTATATSLPGAYPITATVTGTNAASYNIVVVPGTLVVTQAVLTATANNASRAYGAANPAFTGTITGAVNGDVFTETFTTTATPTSPAGIYAIVPVVTGTNLANYILTVVPGVLTIGQTGAALLLQASPTISAYGSPVALTVALTGSNGIVPTGNVLFYDGTILLGTVASANGVASLTVSTLVPGVHTLTAQSVGDANYGPTASNSVTETITGAGGGGTGADYSMTASPASLSIKQGSSGVTTLTITPINGYTGQITLGCVTLPQYASCVFSQATFSLAGTTPATITLTINTRSSVAALSEPLMPGQARSTMSLAGFALLPAMLLAGVFGLRRRSKLGAIKLLALLVCVGVMVSLSGCVTVTTTGGPVVEFTPVGTSTVTVTATPTNATTGVYHTMALPITITQ